ncbi:MAG: hypothetical protein M3Z75_02815, partial [Actinomycetota bacterium]|nr:hypothetical protein [Actinomycetota bacterium]
MTEAPAESACTLAPASGCGLHAWATRSAGQAGAVMTTPKTTAVGPWDRVAVVAGAVGSAALLAEA